MISPRYRDNEKEAVYLSASRKKTKDLLNRKIKSGEWRTVDIICECGSREKELLSEKNKYGIRQEIVVCRNCGLIYCSPRMDDKATDEFNRTYYTGIASEELPIPVVFEYQHKRGNIVLDFLEQHTGIVDLNKANYIFEMGAGTGGILSRLKGKYGHLRCYGTEYREKEVEYGLGKGINLIQGGIEDFLDKYGDIKFDMVILYHVLEHFTDIQKELSNIRKIMHENTFLYIGVPGVLETHRFYPTFLESISLAHNYYFTKETLDHIMRKNGFEVLYSSETIDAIYKIKPKTSNNLMFDNQYRRNINYILALEKEQIKRKTLLKLKRIAKKVLRIG
jgi:SAM-dependent methyltransferase